MFSKTSALLGLSFCLPAVLGAANSLIQIPQASISPNPTNVTGYLYIPSKLQANPPILVNPHWCHGSAAAAFTGTQLATLADTYGYIMIFPDSPNQSDKCWDVSSTQTLTHNGGGDSQGIASMVAYTLAKYGGNPNRVFSMGTSSGAMMTNVLLGSYPDIFAAGSAWAGVAFGCFAGPTYDYWNSDCASGLVIKTGAEWAAIVKAAYPSYTGFRPKMQVFHGTADTTLYPQNLQEEIKEWTAIFGYSTTPVQTISNNINPNWTTYIYGDKFQATSAAGVDHNIQTDADTVLNWFDLKCSGTGCYSRTGGGSSGTTSTVKTSSTSTTSKTSSVGSTKTTSSSSKTSSSATATQTGATQVKWGQCGGIGYSGPTVCVAGTTCTYSNAWYSQCL